MAAPFPAASRIMGGVDATLRADGSSPFPAFAQIRRVVPRFLLSPALSSFSCGGIVIAATPRDPRRGRRAVLWVATAAHCVQRGAEGGVAVALWEGGGAGAAAAAAGEPIRQDPSVRVAGAAGEGRVDRNGWRLCGPRGVTVFAHPDHRTAPPFPRDVALLRVVLPSGADVPAPLLARAALPEIAAPAGAMALVGFGRLSRDPAAGPSEKLQRADAVLEEGYADAGGAKAFVRGVPPSGSATAPATTTCPGDSGGPLMVGAGPSGVPRVAGVLCCGACGAPGVADDDEFMPVSIYERLDAYLTPASPGSRGSPASSRWSGGIVGILRDESEPPEIDEAAPLPPQTWAEGGGPGAGFLEEATVFVSAHSLAFALLLALGLVLLGALLRFFPRLGERARRARKGAR
jgi:hypothetical protein